MKRVINYSILSDVTSNIIVKKEELKAYKEKLKIDILLINNGYKGKDADIVISKYQEIANSIDCIIKTLEDYIEYFKWLSSNYKENLNKTIQKVNILQNDIEPNIITDNIVELATLKNIESSDIDV